MFGRTSLFFAFALISIADYAVADDALQLCKLLQPADIAVVGIAPSGKPESETSKLKKGEAGAPSDLTMQSCTLLEGSVFDSININTVTLNDKQSEKAVLAWFDSIKDEGTAADVSETTVGSARCHTQRIPSQSTKVNGKVVETSPEQFITGCDRFLGDRNVGIEVIRTQKTNALKPDTVAALLEKVISRLPAKK